jgi:hypothetical protein
LFCFSHSGRMKSNENYRLSGIWYLSLPVDGENRKFPIISVGRVECQLVVVVVVVVRALRNRAPLMIRPPTSLRRLFFFVCFLSFGNTFKQKYIYLNTHRHANVQCDKRRRCQDGGLRRGRAHTHTTRNRFFFRLEFPTHNINSTCIHQCKYKTKQVGRTQKTKRDFLERNS